MRMDVLATAHDPWIAPGPCDRASRAPARTRPAQPARFAAFAARPCRPQAPFATSGRFRRPNRPETPHGSNVSPGQRSRQRTASAENRPEVKDTWRNRRPFPAKPPRTRRDEPAGKDTAAATINIPLELGRVLGRWGPHPCAQSSVANIMDNGHFHVDGIGGVQIHIGMHSKASESLACVPEKTIQVNLHAHKRRVALSRGCDRRLLPQGRGSVDDRAHRREGRDRCDRAGGWQGGSAI